MNNTTDILKVSSRKSDNLLIINKGPTAVKIPRINEDWDLLEIFFDKKDADRFYRNGSEAEYVIFENDRFKRKFKIIKIACENVPQLFEYKQIFMIDDDLVPVDCRIEDIFTQFAETGYRVGQPALTSDSFWSHHILLQDKRFKWRLTNFVEVMCPIMRNDAFNEYINIFDANISGFGFDNYWSYCEWSSVGGVVVLDQTPMRHTRPVRGGSAYQGLSEAKEKIDFFEKYNVPSYSQLVLGGKYTKNGIKKKPHKSSLLAQIKIQLKKYEQKIRKVLYILSI